MTRLMAFYGTLRRRGRVVAKPGLRGCIDVGPCLIGGKLYDLGPFPALMEGDGMVKGELYALRTNHDFFRLDWFEDYFADNEPASVFLRRRVRLIAPDVEAWIYFYNGSVARKARIRSGDWIAHRHGKLPKRRI